MKILFDHQLFSWQRYGGASKYFAMLLNALPREMWQTTTIYSNNAYVEALNLFPHHNFLEKFFFRGQGRIMHELNKKHTCNEIAKGNFDVYHQTHFDPFSLRYLGDKPMVTTFHDINFSTLNPNPTVENWQKISLNRADKIIAISKNTKKDLIRLFSIPENKISVIYHGIDRINFAENYPAIFDFPYILYVGSRSNHKNFDRLCDALPLIFKKWPDLKLVCTWKSFTQDEKKMFNLKHLSNHIIHVSANEHQMRQLYQNAELFVFPSLYEGFGMPILEAMASGCPIAISNSSCFPEIADDAALYFDPYKPEAIADSISRILDSSELRDSLITKGYERVKNFSWEKCAQQHIEVYKSLL